MSPRSSRMPLPEVVPMLLPVRVAASSGRLFVVGVPMRRPIHHLHPALVPRRFLLTRVLTMQSRLPVRAFPLANPGVAVKQPLQILRWSPKRLHRLWAIRHLTRLPMCLKRALQSLVPSVVRRLARQLPVLPRGLRSPQVEGGVRLRVPGRQRSRFQIRCPITMTIMRCHTLMPLRPCPSA